MNHKTKFSIFAVAKEKFVALRKKYGIKNEYDMTDIAQKVGLPVTYLKNIPTNFAGYQDWRDESRFIVVNQALPAHERAWFIAQQIALYAHEERNNSLALDRPWKWDMLDAAPVDLKQKICQLDIDYRAHWLMLYFSTGDEFRAFIRANPTRFWSHTFTSNVVGYHLAKLRVKLWFSKSWFKFGLAKLG